MAGCESAMIIWTLRLTRICSAFKFFPTNIGLRSMDSLPVCLPASLLVCLPVCLPPRDFSRILPSSDEDGSSWSASRSAASALLVEPAKGLSFFSESVTLIQTVLLCAVFFGFNTHRSLILETCLKIWKFSLQRDNDVEVL